MASFAVFASCRHTRLLNAGRAMSPEARAKETGPTCGGRVSDAPGVEFVVDSERPGVPSPVLTAWLAASISASCLPLGPKSPLGDAASSGPCDGVTTRHEWVLHASKFE